MDLFSGENVEIRALCIARNLARRTVFKDFFCLWSRSRDLARAFDRSRQASDSSWIAQLARCKVRIRVSTSWAVRIYFLVGHVPILDSALESVFQRYEYVSQNWGLKPVLTGSRFSVLTGS